MAKSPRPRAPKAESAPSRAGSAGGGIAFGLKAIRKLRDPLLALLSSVLYALSFPNELIPAGLQPLGLLALAPLFAAIKSRGIPGSIGLGALFMAASNLLLHSWIGGFQSLALPIVLGILAAYSVPLFALLKLQDRLFPRAGFALQAGTWVLYEYLRTLGFLGFPYGLMGYSQWSFVPLAQAAALGGVFLVSFLCVLPSALAGGLLRDAMARGGGGLAASAGKSLPAIVATGAVLAAAVAYGIVAAPRPAGLPTLRIGLIQHDMDPWKGTIDTYRKNAAVLMRQSEAAAAEGAELCVWGETAVVIPLEWTVRYREDRDRFLLARDIFQYLGSRKEAYLVGNNEAFLKETRPGVRDLAYYNAALAFEGGKIVGRYRKAVLVPFSESFPYAKELPWIASLLEQADVHFWEKGDSIEPVAVAGRKVGVQICFEDGFGWHSRELLAKGAEFFVAMTSDSWSGSAAEQMQHLAMSALRAAETSRSYARASNGGVTCLIGPDGGVIAAIPPFSEGRLVAEVPLSAATTPYSRWGDAPVVLAALACVAAIPFGLLARLARRLAAGRDGRRGAARRLD